MHITDYRDHIGSSAEKFFKSTLFQSSHLLLGLNCLEPDQTQATHMHADQDKFYFIVEGQGEFAVADATYQAGPGMVIWAPAAVPHGVTNRGDIRLVWGTSCKTRQRAMRVGRIS